MPNQRSCHWWREWSCKGGYCGWMSRLSLCRCCGCHWPREVRLPGRRRWSGSSLSCLRGWSSRRRARTRGGGLGAVFSLILYISKAGRYLWGGVWYFWDEIWKMGRGLGFGQWKLAGAWVLHFPIKQRYPFPSILLLRWIKSHNPPSFRPSFCLAN